MLMNHCQVQCPENKDRGQKAQVKYSCIHSFGKLCASHYDHSSRIRCQESERVRSELMKKMYLINIY